MMGRRIGTLTLLFVGLLLAGAPAPVPGVSAASRQVPKLVTIAALSPGSTLTIFASGISKVINDRTKMSPRMQNFSTYVTFTPMLNSGDLDLGPTVSSEALYAWRGIKPYRKSRNIRLLMAGPDILTAYVTTKSSGIRTIKDLKGKRVALVVTIPTMKLWGVASLKAAGLDPAKDITIVPTSNPNEAVQALMDKRVDVAQSAPGMPKIREADAQLDGIYFLPAVTSDSQRKQLLQMLPGYRISSVKPKTYPGVPKNLLSLARPMYLMAGKDFPDEAAYEIVKAIWEHYSDLLPIHPMFRSWSPREMVAEDATIPYQKGAIRYFKERGVWTAEMERHQKELLSE